MQTKTSGAVDTIIDGAKLLASMYAIPIAIGGVGGYVAGHHLGKKFHGQSETVKDLRLARNMEDAKMVGHINAVLPQYDNFGGAASPDLERAYQGIAAAGNVTPRTVLK